jgi:hypothetical protein
VLGMMELSFPHFSGIISHLQEPETALCLYMCIYNLHITNLPSSILDPCILCSFALFFDPNHEKVTVLTMMRKRKPHRYRVCSFSFRAFSDQKSSEQRMSTYHRSDIETSLTMRLWNTQPFHWRRKFALASDTTNDCSSTSKSIDNHFLQQCIRIVLKNKATIHI